MGGLPEPRAWRVTLRAEQGRGDSTAKQTNAVRKHSTSNGFITSRSIWTDNDVNIYSYNHSYSINTLCLWVVVFLLLYIRYNTIQQLWPKWTNDDIQLYIRLNNHDGWFHLLTFVDSKQNYCCLYPVVCTAAWTTGSSRRGAEQRRVCLDHRMLFQTIKPLCTTIV